jgi:hypothetical protein
MVFIMSRRLCSVRKEFYMLIQIPKFVVRLYNCQSFAVQFGRKCHILVSTFFLSNCVAFVIFCRYLRNTTLTGTVSSEIGRLVALTVL